MKLLNGSELADYIKERQAKQVRNLRQSWQVVPKLALVQTIDDPVIDLYVGLKQRYGADILIETDIRKINGSDLFPTIEALNDDESVHGIIIQLPLADAGDTERAVNAVSAQKDVDGLGANAAYTPATPTAIDWLLTGYNIDLERKSIAIVGNGRLVGEPLAKLWRSQGREVAVFDEFSEDMDQRLRQFDVIVSAAGKAGLITAEKVKIGAVIVDAGTSSEQGEVVGDVADDVRGRDDITITPKKGGVGPLTIAALFENVIASARKVADAKN